MATPACPDDGVLMGFVTEGYDPGGVRDHVEGCPDCRRRLDGLRGMVSSLRLLAPTVRTTTPGAEPGHPAVLGKFFVIGVRREDEAVVTYRGVHSLVQQKEVAIHLARAPVAKDPSARQALLASCKPLTRLDHPRIAQVIDLDFSEDRPYLVLDYVPGPGLDEALASRRFTPAEAATVTAELARALAEAHRLGVAHGALSPRSVVLDEAGHPRLVDFGVARLTGTPPDGPAAPDPAGDLAALGGILKLLLAGGPASGDSRALEALAARATAPDPAARFADADAFARALDRFARPRGFPARPLVVGLLVAASLAVLGWLWLRAR